VISRERRDDMQDWRDWIPFTFRRPHRPSLAKFLVEIGSVLLVTGGIVGELWAGVEINSINGALRGKSAELRGTSDRLVALLNIEIDKARKEASHADLERARLEKLVAPRRLTIEQQQAMARACRRFAGKGVTISSYSGDNEADVLGLQIAAALKAAHLRQVINFGSLHTAGNLMTGVKVSGPDADLVACLESSLKHDGQLKMAGPNSVPVPPGSGVVSTGVAIPSGLSIGADIFVGTKPYVLLPVPH
jgi:hypothetical protein